jgi:hypothetical protein
MAAVRRASSYAPSSLGCSGGSTNSGPNRKVSGLAGISLSKDGQELPSPGRPSLTADAGASRRRSAARGEA